MVCNPLSPDIRKVRVRSGLASPYTFRWVLPAIALPTTPPTPPIGAVDFLSGANVTANRVQGAHGATIHDGNARIAQNPPLGKWQHVTFEVDGELMTPLEDPPLLASAIQGHGNRATLLKARIHLGLGTGRVRSFDCDIGAGVEFDVAAYQINGIEVLIPDPSDDATPPITPTPVGQTPLDRKIETVITVGAYFTAGSPQGFRQPLTYTVPVVLAANMQQNFFVPRVAGALEIEAMADEQQAAADGLIIDFIYVLDQLAEATFTAPPTFFVLSSVSTPGGSHQIPRTLIPDQCNAFRIRRTFAGNDTGASFIQVLNV